MSRSDQQQLARLAARLALRAIQAPAKPGTLALAMDAQRLTNDMAKHAPMLIDLHRACIRAGVTECNHGEEKAAPAWAKIKCNGAALAPWRPGSCPSVWSSTITAPTHAEACSHSKPRPRTSPPDGLPSSTPTTAPEHIG